MPDPVAPEADQQVQATPLDRDAMRTQAMERAAEAFPDEDTGTPTAAGGTGAAGSGAEETSGGGSADDAKGPTGPAGAPDPSDVEDEPPTEPAALKTWLAERDAKIEAGWKERMENQKRSLVGSFNKEKEEGKLAGTLRELDDLDDDELADRVKKDPDAALALAIRARAGDPVITSAAQKIVTEQTIPRIFAAAEAIKAAGGPDLVAIAEAHGEDWEAITRRPNSFYDWLVEQSLELGGKNAVESFKKSKDYKDAIATAREEGKRDALGEFRSPPSADGVRRPASNAGGPESDNPRVAAIQRAAKILGETVDTSDVSAPRRRVSA